MNLIENGIDLKTGNGDPGVADLSNSARPRITVVYTTIEGTLAALDLATRFSEGLNAQIVLLVAAEVALYNPQYQSPAACGFFEKICGAIVEELGLLDAAISLDIYLCRRQVECLQTALEPHSLVVLGGKPNWWRRRERRLERALRAFGHDVLLVAVGDDHLHSEAVIQRMLHTHSGVELA